MLHFARILAKAQFRRPCLSNLSYALKGLQAQRPSFLRTQQALKVARSTK